MSDDGEQGDTSAPQGANVPTCPRFRLAPGAGATIIRLEQAGRADLAQAVAAGSLGYGEALQAAGLKGPRPPRQKRAKAKPRAAKAKPAPVANENAVDLGPPTETEAVAYVDQERAWLEVDATALKRLAAREGDAVIVLAELAVDEGPPQTIAIPATMGSPRKTVGRVWLHSTIDLDAVVSVTIRRKRP